MCIVNIKRKKLFLVFALWCPISICGMNYKITGTITKIKEQSTMYVYVFQYIKKDDEYNHKITRGMP